ncbi:uncharacterized protein LOC124918452 [Impatiens glandulifera]|uniref:uncharacterized protein LOC124918452 n=1 Tax=Impatiens glandulifera TaxID=253017 RepID=UPI001FB17F7E|nr:uncharacterized protein LOC124918452 [Impatiens glandulifera]
MSNLVEPSGETLEDDRATEEWEAKARSWLSDREEITTPTSTEVDDWIQSNQSYLPDDVKSMNKDHLYDLIISLHKSNDSPIEEVKDAGILDLNPARFQRTDQWLPVYSWLESLDRDEAVKSKDILDWLTENPEIRDQLYSRHSRYHLMHYIKKCHAKILKRKKGFTPSAKAISFKLKKKGTIINAPSPYPCATSVNNIPKDSELYLMKHNEASRKYEILTELQKQLSIIFPNATRNPNKTEMNS